MGKSTKNQAEAAPQVENEPQAPTPDRNRPVQVVRLRNIRAAIWANESDGTCLVHRDGVAAVQGRAGSLAHLGQLRAGRPAAAGQGAGPGAFLDLRATAGSGCAVLSVHGPGSGKGRRRVPRCGGPPRTLGRFSKRFGTTVSCSPRFDLRIRSERLAHVPHRHLASTPFGAAQLSFHRHGPDRFARHGPGLHLRAAPGPAGGAGRAASAWWPGCLSPTWSRRTCGTGSGRPCSRRCACRWRWPRSTTCSTTIVASPRRWSGWRGSRTRCCAGSPCSSSPRSASRSGRWPTGGSSSPARRRGAPSTNSSWRAQAWGSTVRWRGSRPPATGRTARAAGAWS